jgi:hypothetical protein
VSIVLHRERLPVPFPLWLACTVLLFSGLALRWLAYRALLDARPRDVLLAMVASASLAPVILAANVSATLGRRVSWRRTPKFRRTGHSLLTLPGARAETALAGACFVSAAIPMAILHGSGIATFIGVGVALQGLVFLAAPLMTLLAERDLRHASRPSAIGASRRAISRWAVPLAMGVSLAAAVVVALVIHGAAESGTWFAWDSPPARIAPAVGLLGHGDLTGTTSPPRTRSPAEQLTSIGQIQGTRQSLVSYVLTAGAPTRPNTSDMQAPWPSVASHAGHAQYRYSQPSRPPTPDVPHPSEPMQLPTPQSPSAPRQPVIVPSHPCIGAQTVCP